MLAALVASLLLGALMLVAADQPASAQQAIDQVCVTGVYVDGACQVRTEEVPDCAPDTCAVDVTRPATCLEADECPIVIDAQQGPPTCPDGALGSAGICYIDVARGPDGCPRGSAPFPDGNCAQPVANRAGAYSCEDGGTLSGRDCTFPGAPVYGFCPASSEPVDGACVDFAIDGLTANCGLLNEDFEALRCIEPAEPLPASLLTCDADAQFIESSCVVPIDGVAVNYCTYLDDTENSSESTNGQCRSATGLAEAVCPDGFSRDASLSRRCAYFEPAQRCAEGAFSEEGTSSNNNNVPRCYSFATLVPGAATCPFGFDLSYSFNGTRCSRTEPAVQREPSCPVGATDNGDGCSIPLDFDSLFDFLCLVDARTSNPCRVIGDDAVRGEGECPHSYRHLLVGTTCYYNVTTSPVTTCATPKILVDGTCFWPSSVAPGGSVCPQPDFSVINGRDCFGFVPALEPLSACLLDAPNVEPGQECRQTIEKVAGGLFCVNSAANFDGNACTLTTPLADSVEPSDYTCENGTFSVVYGPGRPVCLFDEPSENYYCLQGAVNGRSCVLVAPFETATCPALYDLTESGLFCERFRPQQAEYSCGAEGVLTIDVTGFPTCWERQGPQPGDCPGVARDDQCYGFVPHRLTCAIEGCLVSAPAVPAAPVAERGDVDCDGQLILLDALVLARSIADPELNRETTCAATVANTGIRITAADLANDGTINHDDAKRLLQCIVDDNFANCAG